jgi:hypothetical protein
MYDTINRCFYQSSMRIPENGCRFGATDDGTVLITTRSYDKRPRCYMVRPSPNGDLFLNWISLPPILIDPNSGGVVQCITQL